jgi:hypothetical protein
MPKRLTLVAGLRLVAVLDALMVLGLAWLVLRSDLLS